VYQRRQADKSVLTRVVRENLKTLYAAVEEGFAQAALPWFVCKELQDFLLCGRLFRGFAELECEDCHEHRLLAWSCHGRGFCPSCLGRRMAATALNWQAHVLPRVGLRQFVLTLPHALRPRLGYDGALLGAVTRIFIDSVLGFYRRRLPASQRRHAQGGALLVVQRASADLKLNPHLHGIALDGAFVPGEQGVQGSPVFVPAEHVDTSEIADLLQVIRVRILRYLVRHGIVEAADDLVVLPDDFAEREPALAQMAQAAVSGLPPAGPELRRRPTVIPFPGRPGVTIQAPLSVAEAGFTLHAATRAGAEDERARLALCKYVLRPPVANEHVTLVADDLVRIALKRPFRDGTVAVEMDPLSLLSRLCTLVPPPRQHQIRYAGVLAANAKWRRFVVPPPAKLDQPAPTAKDRKPPTHRCTWVPFAQLLRDTLAIDVERCSSCGGKMKLLRVVTSPFVIQRILREQGEPTEPEPLAPARAPPYYKSRVLRRRVGQLDDDDRSAA
jgi:hypothetical protein